MRLSELEKYQKITIQCHDNPDPDALASGWALMKYFRLKERQVRFLYSGRFQIQKSNLQLMLTNLEIPIEYCPEYSCDDDELLITVDCQYGQGNVTTCKAKNVAVVDHHQGNADVQYADIRPALGGCSTLVWKLLKDEGYSFDEDRRLCTALYYGLMTDTGNFSEIHHPLDRDMQDALSVDKTLVLLFCNSNISISEMVIAGNALVHYCYLSNHECGLIEVAPCDPNILGFISDLALQVDKFKICVAYNEVSGGYKLSVRSCTKDVRANEFAAFLTLGIGSGGGHVDKAGGFISRDKFEKEKPFLTISQYLKDRIDFYFMNSEIIYAETYELDTSDMKKYTKISFKMGYADPLDFLEKGDRIVIRTLEGDTEQTITGDFYINIGVKGEVWPMKKEKFEKTYRVSDEPYGLETEYFPTVHCVRTGEVVELFDYAKTCYASGGSTVFAKQLDKIVKIYTAWDREHYYLGNPGDFLVCRVDDVHDIYIIQREVFLKTYELTE